MEAWTETQTIAIPVPGFQPGDAETRYYFILHFEKNGGGGSSARIDEQGVLHATRPGRLSEDGEMVAAEHVYIQSQDYLTGQNRYSFDLENFPLLGFVRSLASSLRRLPPPGTVERGARREGMLRAQRPDPIYQDIVVPELRGENLSFEQTLDLLREASGCDVIQVESQLVIDWCG